MLRANFFKYFSSFCKYYDSANTKSAVIIRSSGGNLDTGNKILQI